MQWNAMATYRIAGFIGGYLIWRFGGFRSNRKQKMLIPQTQNFAVVSLAKTGVNHQFWFQPISGQGQNVKQKHCQQYQL